MPLTQGKTLGPYEIQSLLGAGGMGEVYLARDTRLQRTVAIKVLPAHLSASAELHARFVQEAKSISSLQHPNICVVHDVGSQDGVDYMVMEYVSGQALDKLIPAGGLPPNVATRYAVQIADALARAHATGIVHRDLKPANVMADDSGLVKVLDFGLAKLSNTPPAGGDVGATITGTGTATSPGIIVGTLAYMSPEQAQGKQIDARSDVFSFGAVFYEMLTGKKAFDADSSAALLAAVMRDDPKPVSELRRDVPSELRSIVSRCLKKNPADRYTSGAELLQDLKRSRDLLFPDSGATLSPAHIMYEAKRPRVLLPLLLLLVLIVVGTGWLIRRNREVRWAHEVGVPEISRLYDEGKYGQAFALTMRAEKAIPGDPAVAKLWQSISFRLSIDTTPEGADVFRREYDQPNSPWELVGKTPLKNIRQPRGMFLWKIEKPGYETVLRTTPSFVGRAFPVDTAENSVVLDETSKTPLGMVRVSPKKYPRTLFIPGFEGMPELDLPDYWIDKYEVTNQQYKAFVDAGGYQKPEYWKFEFIRNGKKLTWEEAMAQFCDAAGRPGPKDWVQGEYPKGQGDYPVAGISWYEAAAYAEFAGKSLPTIYHWNRAAGPFSAAFIVPLSNLGTNGVVPVGSKPGVGPWGTYDMAGNVKEWTATAAESSNRWVLGGAWDDPIYMFVDPDAQSPWLRAPDIGFRTVKYIDAKPVPTQAFGDVPSPRRDFSKVKPVSDQVFQAYRSIYSYDKTPLNATVEQVGDEDDWKIEKATYAAGYGNERAIAYLFLPKKSKPPYQTVIFFPGSNALLLRKFAIYPTAALDGILRSGRAVIYPIYKSTYERGDGWETDVPDTSNNWRDHVVMWLKDASRALDYVDSRPDLDHAKIGYYGYSWGAVMGAMIPALDSRIKVNVLALGGMEYSKSLPEVDKINFLPRVKQPTLMLNGHYDFFFPVDSTQIPFYNLLGSKKDQKKRIQYETGHNVPRIELIKESLNWLDLWLGPVQ
jgi:serine/threonine protein kinase/formylglycine-generating enzyme required for sulfatase activity/cephalosporin-C deacetylase-like acetyl esterase